MSNSMDSKVEIPKSYRQWVLARRPVGTPVEDDFKLVSVNTPEALEKGTFLVQIKYLSVDPYMRGVMNEINYGRSVAIGGVITGGSVGIIVKSENPSFKVGDHVFGYFGWTEYAISNGGGIKKVPADYDLSHTLGVLGMPGATAYLGFFEICNPKPFDTVFVSGAAGAVGSLVGQLAKLASCRVVGSVGSLDKAKICSEMGFDSVIIYKDKDIDTLHAEIKQHCPNGIDCFFDNTGGSISDAVFKNLNSFARVSICGQISVYNNKEDKVIGRPILLDVLKKQIKVEGFTVNRWSDWTVAHSRLHALVKSKKLIVKEDIVEGFDKMRDAFLGLFTGKNVGKAIVKV